MITYLVIGMMDGIVQTRTVFTDRAEATTSATRWERPDRFTAIIVEIHNADDVYVDDYNVHLPQPEDD